jgi:hypothetical protein
MGFLRGQGATEYLVLLAVVLIIALVSVALLGFFPGMASDSQITQSQTYWQGASPISIVEFAARHIHNTGGSPEVNHTVVYMKVKNSGAYRVSISKILAGGSSIDTICTGGWGPCVSISSKATLAPGEEYLFDGRMYFGLNRGNSNYSFFCFCTDSCWGLGSSTFPTTAAKSYCSRTQPYGSLVVDGFGFEYVEYIEGQQITKRQIGAKPLIVKCLSNYD